MKTRLSALCIVLSIACGNSEQAPAVPSTPPPSTPPPSTPSAPAPSAPAPSAPATPTASTPTAPTAEPRTLTPEERTRVRTATREGRTASHEGRHADALASFRAALALDTTNRRLRCEAGYVAHLAGDEAEAERLIDAALVGMPDPADVPEALRVPYAMCLYNGGLVYQALGDIRGAREAWTDSLTLRPNDTVRTHLDALPAATDAAEEASALALTVSMTDAEVAVALLRHYVRLHAEEEGDDPDELLQELEEGGDLEDETSSEPIESPSPDVRATLVTLDPTDTYRNYVLVLRRGDQIAAFPVLEVSNPGELSMLGEGTISSTTFEDLVPGGSPELRLRTELDTGDDDLGGCVSFGTRETADIVCTFETLACAEVVTSTVSTESCDSECIREWDERCGHGYPRDGFHETTERETPITWSGGSATITVVGGHARDVLPGLVGTHDFPALLRVAGLERL